MLKTFSILISLAAVLYGCGHSQTHYAPSARQGMTWDRAVSVIERGFYEDYGKERPESVHVTNEAIILSDGSITTAQHAGTAVPVYGAAVLVGSTSAKTIAAGQRIYLNSLAPAIVLKRNARDNRYAVIIRTNPGVTSRRVFFRTEQRAEEFADALEFVRMSGRAAGESRSNESIAPSAMSKEQYKQIQIERLMQENLPYEEYVRRMREIEAQ